MRKILKIFSLLLVGITLLGGGGYLFRDSLLKIFLGPYLTLVSGFQIKVADILTTHKEGWHFDAAMKGTCAGAPLDFNGKIDLKNRLLTQHRLSVGSFPLKTFNRQFRRETGLEFTQGNVDVTTTGAASAVSLNLKADLLLKDLQVSQPKEKIPFKAGLANYFLLHQTRLPLRLTITGTPENPVIGWPANMKRMLAERLVEEIRQLEPVKELEAKVKTEIKAKSQEIEEKIKEVIPEEVQEQLNPLKEKFKIPGL